MIRYKTKQQPRKDHRMRDSLHVKTEEPEQLLGGVLTEHLLQGGNVPLTRLLPASPPFEVDSFCKPVNSGRKVKWTKRFQA